MSASSARAWRRNAAMSSRLRASSCATSQGTARRAPSRGASAGVQAGVSARSVSGVMNHSRFQVAILSSAGAALREARDDSEQECDEPRDLFMRATIARGRPLLERSSLPAVPRVARAADRAPAARVDGKREAFEIRGLSAGGRGSGGGDEGLAIGRNRDRQLVLVRRAGRRQARGRRAARTRCCRCRRRAAGRTFLRRSAAAAAPVMASVRCTRSICWR